MKKFYLCYKKKIDKLLWMLGFFLFIYVFFIILFAYVAPFVIAFLLATLLEPFVRLLNKVCKASRGQAAAIGILFVYLILGILGRFLGSRIIQETRSFMGNLPAYIEESALTIERFQNQFSGLLHFIPPGLNINFETLSSLLVQSLTTSLSSGVKNNSVDFFVNFGVFIISLLFTTVATYFFIKDKIMIQQKIMSICPLKVFHYYHLMREGLFDAVGGYLKYSFIMMCIAWFIFTIGLFVIGYEYALLMGIILGFVEFLPMVGTGTVIIPWAILNLLSGDYSLALSLLTLFGINFVVRQLLEPKILSTQIGLYPLVTLVAIYTGLKLWGPLGIFMALIIVISGKVILNSDYIPNK